MRNVLIPPVNFGGIEGHLLPGLFPPVCLLVSITGCFNGLHPSDVRLSRRSLRFPSPFGKGEPAARDAHQEKQLLYSMHGMVPEGSLCALMGPSGSGKSTLLDLLTGRRDCGRCEGEVLFKGSSIAEQQVQPYSRVAPQSGQLVHKSVDRVLLINVYRSSFPKLLS